MICKTCRFYEMSSHLPGVCRRKPPTVNWSDENTEAFTSWPSVERTDWCGEYSALKMGQCFDCAENTFTIKEYFIVNHEVWDSVANDYDLCVGCLEARLGRDLNKTDFNFDIPINQRTGHSNRLLARMAADPPERKDYR